MNKIVFFTLVLLINVFGGFAQQTFKYQSALQKVDKDGFYQINLAPGIIAKSKADLSDLRIIGPGKRYAPYLFGAQLAVKDQSAFIAFPQLKTPDVTDTVTTFIADNSGHLTLNQLYLLLRNTSVQRTVNLAGSDDLNHWYAIKENMLLADADAADQKKGTYLQMINFPFSTYRYLRIRVINKNREPVAILQAGIFKQQSVNPVYLKLADGTLKQKDSAGISHIILKLNDNYQVNKLHLSVSGQKYYMRKISIYEAGATFKHLVMDTVIGSSGTQDLNVSVKTKTIELQVVNGDNPPLEIKSITAYQLEQSLVTYLEKDKQYYLLLGDEKAAMPDYDLKFFGDSLQHQLIQISHAKIARNAFYKPVAVNAKKSNKLYEWLIGFAGALAIAILILLTTKMTNEVKKRTEEKKND